MSEAAIKQLSEEINFLKQEVADIKAQLREDFELSDWAKAELAKARKEPQENLVKHEEILKRFS